MTKAEWQDIANGGGGEIGPTYRRISSSLGGAILLAMVSVPTVGIAAIDYHFSKESTATIKVTGMTDLGGDYTQPYRTIEAKVSGGSGVKEFNIKTGRYGVDDPATVFASLEQGLCYDVILAGAGKNILSVTPVDCEKYSW